MSFEGHHREYASNGVEWILGRVDLDVIRRDIFNYSVMVMQSLVDEDARRCREMEADASKREIIFIVARKIS